VDLKDSGTSAMLANKAYKDIYREIRGAVDLCHRDGSLKSAVAANPAKYIHRVPRLPILPSTFIGYRACQSCQVHSSGTAPCSGLLH
jgi:hypothetical protein